MNKLVLTLATLAIGSEAIVVRASSEWGMPKMPEMPKMPKVPKLPTAAELPTMESLQ